MKIMCQLAQAGHLLQCFLIGGAVFFGKAGVFKKCYGLQGYFQAGGKFCERLIKIIGALVLAAKQQMKIDGKNLYLHRALI
ncbi:hypothetical protein FBY54_1814 [Zymomonas mobilis]|nr:hypothetical protein FBY54_1814 [Zymomonas mobilis]